MSAISRLESLSRDFDRRPLSSHSEETRTIIAKVQHILSFSNIPNVRLSLNWENGMNLFVLKSPLR